MVRFRRGSSTLPYALIVGLVAVVALLSISSVGGNVNKLLLSVSNRLENSGASGSGSGGGGGGTGSTATAPANLSGPVISGTVAIGQTLSSNGGTWSGSPTPTITHQWRRAGSPIGGATNATYVIQAADQGAALSVTATATNSAGSASATSTATAAVPAATYSNCQTARDAGNTTSGIYALRPPSASADISVFCDMVGAVGWMLIFRDPSSSYDVPTAAASLNAWTGTLTGSFATTQGMLSVTKPIFDELAPVKQARFADFSYTDTTNTFGAWWTSGNDTGIMAPGSSSVGTNYFSYNINSNGASTYASIGRWAGGGGGCPMWSSGVMGNVTTGTAGAGDANYHNGGGCWSYATTGPTYGGYGYVR